MFSRLFLLFTLVPFLDLYLLVQVGSAIGVMPTILLVVLTGVAGAWLARMAGFATMLRVQQSLHMGRLPANEMVEGALILLAGVLLVAPGLITDCVGLILLIPPVRHLAAKWLRGRLEASVRVQGAATGTGTGAGFTYYTWHSSGRASDAQGRDDIYSGSIRGGRSGHDTDALAPRQAVVIDCEPVEDDSEDSASSPENPKTSR